MGEGPRSRRSVTSPTFRSESLTDWFEARGGAGIPEPRPTATYCCSPTCTPPTRTPGEGRGAREGGTATSESPMWTGAARPALKGMLDESSAAARDAVETLVPDVADGWDVVVVEPTDAVMLQTDYHDLLDDGDASDVPDADVATVHEHLRRHGVRRRPPARRGISTSTRPPNRSRITGTATRRRRRRTITRSACSDVRGYGVDPLDLLLLWDGGLVRLRGRAPLDEQGDRPDPLRSGRRERR